MSNLPVSQLVRVDVNLGPVPAQAQNLSNLLILGSTGVIDTTERYRTYSTLTAIAEDFGTTAPEYLAATEWFDQSPQPAQVLIGTWISPTAFPTGTNGQLIGGTISTTLAQFQAISAGSFTYHDSLPTTIAITALDFTSVSNMNGVATVINAALAAASVTSPVFTWNAIYKRFEFKIGTQHDLGFFTVASTGTDISHLLGLSTTSSGAYSVPHLATSETALEAVVLFDDLAGQKWYALFIDAATNNDHIAVAGFIQGSNTKHAYGVNTQEAGVLSAVSTSDIAYELAQYNYAKTSVQYSSSNKYAICSFLARILTTDYNANKSVINLMYKQEPGVIAESLSQTQMNALVAKNCNVFVKYDNNTNIIEPGIQSNGDFTDTIFGADWLAIDVQNTLYNILYTSTTKIPQTDEGNHILTTGIVSVLDQGVTNGLLAAGTWTDNGFGTLKQGDYLPKGYYVYAPSIDSQNPSDRAQRKSVVFQIAAKLAGAIQTVNVILNVNR